MFRGILSLSLIMLFAGDLPAQVIINEIASASNERMLAWSAAGAPRLGSGAAWQAQAFVDSTWATGSFPAGWGTAVLTNLQSAMQNKTPTLYARKTFTVTPSQAALTTPLILQVEADDGFVAYLNGKEVARANCGAPGHFLYAAQPAYNANTAPGLTEIQVGPANSFLQPGVNLLAIEAHNKDLSSNFRINAGLKVLTSTASVTLTKASHDFNVAVGGSRTHTNTAGAITNLAAGAPIPGGWISSAADPVSDSTWTSLQIVTTEMPGAGVGGGGGLRYFVTQSGTNRGAYVRAPAVNMINAWTQGAISPATLASTTVRFRYRTTGDLQFGFRLDPTTTQSAQSLDGFPVLGLPPGGAADFEWTTAAGGYKRDTISATGTISTTINGSINSGLYESSYAGCQSGQVTVMENNLVGVGPGGTAGVLQVGFDTFPAVVGTMVFRLVSLAASWTSGAITNADFQRSRLSFKWKLPAGRRMKFMLEPPSGATPANSITIGSMTGTGNWETFSGTLSDLQNSAALLTRLNQTFANNAKLAFHYDGVPFASGESLFVDSANLYTEQPGSTLEEELPVTFGNAAGAVRAVAVDAGGAAAFGTTGAPVANASLFVDPASRGFGASLVEDSSGGSGGVPGFLRCAVTDTPDNPAPWGFVLSGLKVRNWTAGGITAAQLGDVLLQFAVKIPAGVTVQLFAEPAGGSAANRADLGSLTGNGTWQTVIRNFAPAGNVENFRSALNAAGTNAFQLNFTCPSNATAGDQIGIDDVQVLGWRTYQVVLNQGANQQRFMDYLNQNNLISFVPTFVKNTAAPSGGGALYIDDYEISYTGPDPLAAQQLQALGAAGWKYFVGIAEPSGGLFDPALVTTGYPAPPGEEDDYDNPSNFRDWVELKNTTALPVSLANWSLSDDAGLPQKWRFPATATIPANGYLIVMCDGRNEANGLATYLHASFSLSANGEAIRLYDNAGALVDAATGVPDQDTWHTWARNPADNLFAFCDSATPGAANAGTFAAARVKTPDFLSADGVTSLPGGFYTGPQTLVLQSPTAGASIRFTTDGSEPTETTGSAYSGPLTLAGINNKTGTVIRARAFLSGRLPSETKTRTYLVDQHAALKTLPAMVFSGDAGRNFFLPHGIMAISGGTYSGELWAPNGPASYDIPLGRGDPYERLITAEWHHADGSDGWTDNVGVRISSSPYSRPRLLLNQTANSPWTMDHRQKPSFNLYWRDDYGNSKLDAPIIPGNDIRRFKQLRIRAGKNDINNPFIIDEFGRRLYHDMGWVQPIGAFCGLYINGSFKGLYNPTERLREPMFQEHYRTENLFDVRYIGEQVDGDVTFWNQMQTALNTLNTSPTHANYLNVQNYLDPVNLADYFLFALYVNYDDWPGNNWAAQRERTAAGRYRMVAWDVEGAFGRFGKQPNFDRISDLLGGNTECGNLFKRLYQSPEWRLLFADRIQKHFFNGGVLDDRAGAASYPGKLVASLAAQVQPMLGFLNNNANLAVDMNWYNSNSNPSTGRRAFLMGPAATTGTFRNKLLWPATEPPAFSQFGGAVAANYPLMISHTAPAGSKIYYTLDGSDPRVAGTGAVSPTAIEFAGSVPLSSLVTVKARVKNANGEWSPLTEAFFQPGAEAPTAATLVVAEINYHPSDPNDAEAAALITDAGDFEFVRLLNVGAAPMDLRQLQFSGGLAFNFASGDVPAIPSGGSVLVVKRRTAFEKRYGTGYGGIIAGEYAGSLNNAGESLTLEWGSAAAGTNPVVLSFSFDDDAPWPAAADGFGATLMLKAPFTAPDHNDPNSWTASAQAGGLPGGAPRSMNYGVWRGLSFVPADAAAPATSGPLADPDNDGLTNLAEYALGSNALLVDAAAFLPIGGIEVIESQTYRTLEYRIQAGVADATVAPQVSADLAAWSGGAGNVVVLSGPVNHPDGSVSWKVRDATPFNTAQRRFIRLSVTLP